jgi:CxxC motif-containing protein
MLKKLTCIECPKGCALLVDIENSRAIKITGHQCPKGETYAVKEIECPVRIITSTVMTKGFDLKLLPVRTDKPIPKSSIFEAIKEIRKIIIQHPVKTGDVISQNFLNLNVNLLATRDLL